MPLVSVTLGPSAAPLSAAPPPAWPGAEAGLLAAEFDRLAAELQRRGGELAAALRRRVGERLGSGSDLEPPLASFLTTLAATHLHDLGSGELPEARPAHLGEALALQRALAGFSAAATYRDAHMLAWRGWFDLVEADPALDPPARRELLARGSEFFFRYADRIAAHLAAAAPPDLDSLSARRLLAVEEILAGEDGAAAALDFDLERHHIGLLAAGEGARAALGDLAARCGRPLLYVSGGAGEEVWGWLSGARALDRDAERELAAVRPASARIAVGLECFGAAGFRATHRQALRASRLRPSSPLARFEEVVVEALAGDQEEDARAFVAHELRGIEDESGFSRRLRQTLRAYFASELNAASAASALGVHQQTVANRIRAAEERLGLPSLAARRVELEIALRLRSSLQSA